MTRLPARSSSAFRRSGRAGRDGCPAHCILLFDATDGIFNVVTSFGPEVGTDLISHPGVAKITFTGPDTTGAKVYETVARSLKRVFHELGGKSPNIVFEDADLSAAAAGAVSGIFAATGLTCIAGSRLLVQNSIKDKFVDRLLELARSAKIGDPMQSSTNIGPITTPAQYKKVLEYIDIAKSAGARCLLGGKPASGEGIVGGQLVEPTIFTGVNNTMRIARVAKQQKRQVNILRRRTTFYHFNGLGSPNGGLSAFRRNIQRQLSYFSRSYALGCARRAKTMLAISMSWSDQ